MELFSLNLKIKVIDNYIISIRPCELKNIGLIFGLNYNIRDDYVEYSNLMRILKEEEINILEILLKGQEEFKNYIEKVKGKAENNNITSILIKIRKHLLSEKSGCNVLKYLLVKMDNQVIKNQISNEANKNISYLYLVNQSIPFDAMPYAMSLCNHNISWSHLINSIDIEGRNFELLGRYVKNNCESNNILYTPCKEVEKFGDIDELIQKYNNALVKYGIDTNQKHILIKEYSNIYIKSYEENSIEIINRINSYKVKQNKDIIERLESKKQEYSNMDLSKDKKRILNNIFRKESVCIIHGPAGTGKTKLLEVLATIFKDYNKIFLSNTNTSVENLKTRISSIDICNSTFKTISNYNKNDKTKYDILIIDECSSVSNNDMLKVLKEHEYQLIILVGDVYQIESIKYGSWFSLAYNLFKQEFVHELECIYRTNNKNLQDFWKMVRENNNNARNKITNQEYSSNIDLTIFDKIDRDEIILCLNYDGLYGINNINRILQEKNKNEGYSMGVDLYKEDDPIVFNDCPRFRNLYNNLKGIIKKLS